MTNMNATVVLRHLMERWARIRAPQETRLTVSLSTIELVRPIRVIRDGEARDATFTYPFSLN